MIIDVIEEESLKNVITISTLQSCVATLTYILVLIKKMDEENKEKYLSILEEARIDEKLLDALRTYKAGSEVIKVVFLSLRRFPRHKN